MWTKSCAGPPTARRSALTRACAATIGDATQAAWSYREVDRIGDLMSCEPDKVTVTIGAEHLHLEPGQHVVAHGAHDR
jgi:hypothetical protein